MDNQNFYFAFDGDEIGRKHAEAILSDDVNSISEVSANITHANEMVRDFVESNGGRMISFGGDEGVFEAPADFINSLEQLRKDYELIIGATLSIGFGSKPSEAAKALLAAKERGKNQAVQYDESAEQDAQETQEHRDMESSSSEPANTPNGKYTEGSKPEEDGITPSDPSVTNNNKGYDSGYKDSSKEDRGDSYRQQDLTPPIIAKPNLTPKNKVEEATSADVPEASRGMNNVPSNPGEIEPQDKKPVSKFYDGQADWVKPGSKDGIESMAQPNDRMPSDEETHAEEITNTSNVASQPGLVEKPSDLKYTSHGQQEPQADMPTEDSTSDAAEQVEEQDMGGEPVQHCPSCTCDEHSQEQPMEQVLDQHIDNATDYTNTIGEGGDGGNVGSDSSDMDDTLDQHVANATEMNQDMDSNGVSRPGDYNQKATDLGLSEEDSEEPNLDEVLRDGLDSHADNIQREKVVNMVGEALEAFKGQKKILDKAKDQAPELYDACISMLRSMIELCSLAGIDQSQPEQDVNEIEGQGEAPTETPGAEGQPQETEEAPSPENGYAAPEGDGTDESEESCPNCGHPKDDVTPEDSTSKEKPAAPGGAAPFPKT
jgi:hypothetical protein